MIGAGGKSSSAHDDGTVFVVMKHNITIVCKETRLSLWHDMVFIDDSD